MEHKLPKIEKLYRQFTATVDAEALAARAEGDDSIPLAISSEEPVDRWFGREVLSHDAKAVDLSRAKRGLPFLMDHDTGVQVGRVKDIAIGADGVLRGRAVFGNHPDAAWVRKDMLDGIRDGISVGYRVLSMVLSKQSDEGDEYVVDRWLPMEVSTVPVPADATVGVGRSSEAGALTVEVKGTSNPASPEGEGTMEKIETPAVEPGKPTVRSAEDIRTEIANIYALGAEHGCMDLAAKAVERGISRDKFASEILERKVADAKDKKALGVDLTEKEHRVYNLQRGLLAQATGDWSKAGLEREVSLTLAKDTPNYQGGFVIPWNMRASVTGNIAGTSSLGGAGVATEMRELIDLLRNRIVVGEAGATMLFGLSSNISFPRQITANSLTWTGENPSSANTLTAATLDNVTLSPKTAMVSTAYSRQLLIQSSFDAAAFVANDIARVVAIGVDYAALNGVGSSNQPTGIRVQSGITNTTLGSNGANLAWSHIVGNESSVATANADIGSISYLFTPATRSKLKQTLQNTTSGASYIWGADDRVNGYRALVTNQLPSNLTKGTNTTVCHAAVFGVFSELLVGTFGPGLETIVDPYTVAGQNMIAVHGVVLADIAVKHPAAFVKMDDILVS